MGEIFTHTSNRAGKARRFADNGIEYALSRARKRQLMSPSPDDRPESTARDGAVVYLVDDDLGTLDSLSLLLGQAGFPVRQFTSALDFLDGYSPAHPGCLLLDLAMPEIDGLSLLERLAADGVKMPTIIVTGVADVPSCVRAFKLGVLDFLEKPIDPEELLGCVRKGMAQIAASVGPPPRRTGHAAHPLDPTREAGPRSHRDRQDAEADRQPISGDGPVGLEAPAADSRQVRRAEHRGSSFNSCARGGTPVARASGWPWPVPSPACRSRQEGLWLKEGLRTTLQFSWAPSGVA